MDCVAKRWAYFALRGPALLVWAEIEEAMAQTEARVYTVVGLAEVVPAVALEQVVQEYSGFVVLDGHCGLWV